MHLIDGQKCLCAKNRRICGRHTTRYLPRLEEDEIHNIGYLNAIKKWLNAVHKRVEVHVKTCKKGCKKKVDGKVRMRPLDDTVRLMNRVSYIAKVFLDLNIIHACPYGAAYAAHKGLLAWNPAKERFYVRKDADARIIPLTKSDIEQALAKGAPGK